MISSEILFPLVDKLKNDYDRTRKEIEAINNKSQFSDEDKKLKAEILTELIRIDHELFNENLDNNKKTEHMNRKKGLIKELGLINDKYKMNKTDKNKKINLLINLFPSSLETNFRKILVNSSIGGVFYELETLYDLYGKQQYEMLYGEILPKLTELKMIKEKIEAYKMSDYYTNSNNDAAMQFLNNKALSAEKKLRKFYNKQNKMYNIIHPYLNKSSMII